ncbi:NAD-dependent epimerase/dehydratase family protein [uncultured Desulfosarcina sp.]|uniref:NAD-dependent epimerase/dehydratase family protein n=1 Tax=uncultured Desulfosarcina sp. TaxID=218289 RepID=UPI0029C7B809|nr:NAD-dependent epimerase/dehydratase family protein [uncultured Desulfosarcina sp.]
MIIGSGMLARSFTPAFAQCKNVCIYAAGVSNSSCLDDREFSRERQRLENAIGQNTDVHTFVYFGTCSIADPEARNTPYVQHKIAMEQLVAKHPQSLILRLPQVAGITPNPHTLLNFIYARIARSERFNLWRLAKRNIIDVTDVVLISQHLIANRSLRNTTINIANKSSYPMTDIVSTMGHVVGKHPIYDLVEQGADYAIETQDISPLLEKARVHFGSDYLEKVLAKYYHEKI